MGYTIDITTGNMKNMFSHIYPNGGSTLATIFGTIGLPEFKKTFCVVRV